MVQFQPSACVRSEGLAVTSPVREGGGKCHRLLPERRRCATVCAGPSGLWAITGWTSPPSRTGLLTAGPSDLGLQIEPLPKYSYQPARMAGAFRCDGANRV